jgi:glyoxylase-like metal-dependent hydrolase (beta-lactamase superfamily II)/rhodanese-related sulfurtransferase
MIADEQTKTAAVIDPQRDINIYVNDARERGFEIKHVILTHFHADFVSGHIELRDKLGAQIYFGARAEAEFEFQPLREGDSIKLGSVRLVVMETPGHTPEGISLVLYDDATDADMPKAVFTGDTLFLGDVGRPDLLASIGVTAEELAEMLYDSLHRRILTLPDETLVYPAHGAGSMCGKQLSDEAVSTLGEQRRYNYALQPMSRDEFVKMVTADQPEAPAYFAHDAMLNRQNRPSLETSLSQSLNPLELDRVLQLQDEAAQIVDVRDAASFAAAHLRGSLNIGIDGRYATWAGTMLQKDSPIVVIAEEDRVEEAIMRLGRIGFDNVVGYLQNGMLALDQRPELLSQTPRITAVAMHELEEKPTVIDVRTPTEWDAGHIAGSINIPLNRLSDRLDEVPATGVVVVHCQGGYRSSTAASMLHKAGRSNLFDLVGGYQAWSAAEKTSEASVQPE